MFTWYWLADVCAAESTAFVPGHALAKAIHGAKAKNDRIDSHKIASLLHGGPGQGAGEPDVSLEPVGPSSTPIVTTHASENATSQRS